MAKDFKALQWIVSSVTINRKVDENGKYPDTLIESTLSFGEKVLDNAGNPKVDALGSELWKEHFTKKFRAGQQDVIAFLTAQANPSLDLDHKIIIPAVNIAQLGLDTMIMAAIYPFCSWMVDTKRWKV